MEEFLPTRSAVAVRRRPRLVAAALALAALAAALAAPNATARFFLPTGAPENVTEPSVEVDARGDTHLVYARYARGDAFYVRCPPGCGPRDVAAPVRLATSGTVTNAMLALDARGRPHVLLDTLSRTYYATCTNDCRRAEDWKTAVVLDHGSLYQVTGEAFALDPRGRPRFLLHGWVGTFGPTLHETSYVGCDAGCLDPGRWTRSVIVKDQTWQESQLRFDAAGRPRVATVAHVRGDDGKRVAALAYAECDAGCDTPEGWRGRALAPAYLDRTTKNIDPAVSMALTRSGAPRVWALARDESGRANPTFFACDRECADPDDATAWRGAAHGASERVSSGLDLALDAQDRPRAVFNLADNIFLTACEANCAGPNAAWQDREVELSARMKADAVLPYPNCTVAAWFLSDPSVALAPDGSARVAYRAVDVSGGLTRPDFTRAPCSAGADMSLARLAVRP